MVSGDLTQRLAVCVAVLSRAGGGSGWVIGAADARRGRHNRKGYGDAGGAAAEQLSGLYVSVDVSDEAR